MDRFKGRIVHPQSWPDDIDLEDKKVVVIGSGATAATLMPNIADKCAHVTMLQRSPTYFRTRPQRDRDRRGAAPAAGRARNGSTRSSAARSCSSRMRSRAARFAEPEQVKKELIGQIRAVLGPDSMTTSRRISRRRYRPWRQRIAFVPDADSVPGHRERQGLRRHRRDRTFRRERHPAEIRQDCSKPTSSSPQPASISMCSATSPSRSTASRSTSATP